MDWTGTTNSPTFALANILNIYGSSLTFISAMAISGASSVVFRENCTLTTAGLTLTGYYNVKNDKTLTMADAVTTTGTYGFFMEGGSTLNTGSFDITCNIMRFLETGGHTANLGSSIITATAWLVTGGLTLSAGTSTIKISGTGVFEGSGQTYHHVELNGTAHTISGDNTFHNLAFRPSGAQTITFTDTSTQTVDGCYRTGTGTITFQGSGVGGWAMTKSDKLRVVLNNMSISRSTVLPYNVWFAPPPVTDGSNNVNWIFAHPPTGGGWWVINK